MYPLWKYNRNTTTQIREMEILECKTKCNLGGEHRLR
jgi:hypothetical protein